ncbi:peptidase M23B [Spiribacter salinus M19-40]|uniref:Peptidase M23B n=1 Tax=Spiribacter salinus M19-40 TaxID=1260251 RepID=R4V7H9_9GAMM|nr:peptidoglycan DD-metalloendopeptidase family protein [Spiribacter salinus]AGM40965.1 peptidase M23B [Spiribacter salinus M19-40]
MKVRGGVLLAVVMILAGCTEFDYASDRALRQADTDVVAGDVHVVERGETLYQIAWQYGLDFRDVARWNDLRSADLIFAGQELVLSGPADTGSGQTQSSAQSSGLSGPIAWQWPVEGEIVGAYDANAIGKRGIRIGAEPGSVVAAAGGGDVVYSGSGLRGYGNLVIIKHNDQFLTAYGYNSELLVGEGERVEGGDAIARVATDGERAGHLHFEIRQQGDPVNPASYLP